MASARRPATTTWVVPTGPVINVSWEEAQVYAAWLSQKTGKKYRVPSESEWEYAARGATTTPWYWGTFRRPAKVHRVPASTPTCMIITSREAHPMYVWSNHPCADGFPETAPVGKFKPNAYGLYDMAGNVREWVLDCHMGDYSNSPTDGSASMDPGLREAHRARRRVDRRLPDRATGLSAHLRR